MQAYNELYGHDLYGPRDHGQKWILVNRGIFNIVKIGEDEQGHGYGIALNKNCNDFRALYKFVLKSYGKIYKLGGI